MSARAPSGPSTLGLRSQAPLLHEVSTVLDLLARPDVGAALDRAPEASADQRRVPVVRTSCYVAMPDGVRLAVDVYLPAERGPGDRLGAVLLLTRYHRRKVLADWLAPELELLCNTRLADAQRYGARGYAHVVVDVRGSGASFGRRDDELGAAEAADLPHVINWVLDQSWSNGLVTAVGTSYEGSTAELLAATGHPAVRAVIPRFALFDAYPDIGFPGGALLTAFIPRWAAVNAALDSDTAPAFMSRHAGPTGHAMAAAVGGVAPVDDDRDEVLKAEAVREHGGNADIMGRLRQITFRDDRDESGWQVDDIAAYSRLPDLVTSGAAVCSYSGWFDGAYAWAAVKRFVALGGNDPRSAHRLVLGPWDHGGRQMIDPTTTQSAAAFDHVGHHLEFFAAHTGVGADPCPRVHYFTMGEHAWKTADSWPPAGFRPADLHLAGPRRLAADEAPRDGSDRHVVDMSTTTMPGNRWVSYVNIGEERIAYPNRSDQDARLLTYDSGVLAEDLEVTGHPALHLHLSCSTSDTLVIAYLEELTADGRVHMVTEGQLRASMRALAPDPPVWDRLAPAHRFLRAEHQPLAPDEVVEVAFGLIPVSYRFAAGSRIRLALAGADHGTFERVPTSGPPPTWTVHRGPAHPSRLTLPVRTTPAFHTEEHTTS